MSDFQSFLFQSMHLIGLKAEDSSSVDCALESGVDGSGVAKYIKNSSRRKLNTIEEPQEVVNCQKKMSINVKNTAKTYETRQSSIKTTMTTTSVETKSTPTKVVYRNQQTKIKNLNLNVNSGEEEEEELEKPTKTQKTMSSISTNSNKNSCQMSNNDRADIISQLQQTSMGNISICTTETFISTNSNSVNATASTNLNSNDDHIQPTSQKYTTIVESDSNFNANDTFPEPPKFDTEILEKNEQEKFSHKLKNNSNNSMTMSKISSSSDSIVCVKESEINYNDNKQINEKKIENKDVTFDLCSNTSSVNCLDNTSFKNKNENQLTALHIEPSSTSLPATGPQQISCTNIADESFIDNNGYNNNISNIGVIPNSTNASVYDCERDVKSPKPVAESISQRILKKISSGDFSPLKSIFNKHYHNKNNSSASVSTNEISKSSASSRSSEKLNKHQDSTKVPNESNPPKVPIDCKSMESYLAKFEEEILRKAKTEILNECKMMNFKQTELLHRTTRVSGETESIKKYLNEELFLNTDMDNLEKYNSLLNRLRFNANKRYNTLPLLYSYLNDKADATQITKWLKTIEKASGEMEEKEPISVEKEVPSKLSSKQYLINKKRELMDKVAKKMHSKKVSRSSTVIETQVYANIDISESLPEVKKNRKKKSVKKESSKSSETLSEFVGSEGFYINDKHKNDKHRDIEDVKKTKKVKNRTRSEVPSVEENNSLVREQLNVTLSDDLEEIIEADKKNKKRQEPVPPPPQQQQKHRKSTSALKEETEDESRIQEVNIKRKKPVSINQSMMNDHFYNEINEVELRNTIRLKEKKKEALEADTSLTKMKTLKAEKMNRTAEKLNTNTKPKSTSSSTTNIAASMNSATKKLPPTAPTTRKTAAEHAKNFLRKPSHLLAKLKSPERKILYNDWFAIIKKMDSDPKFDLETLVRTRGRFTEHDRISYRDRLQEQKLRSARSEPNFGAMKFLSQQNSEQSSEDSAATGNSRRPKTHSKPPRGNQNSRERSRAHRTVHLGPTRNHDGMMKSESYCENVGRKWDFDRQNQNEDEMNVSLANNNTSKASSNTLSNALKLTLQKSDVELIKDILKKKHKNLSTADLNAMTINALRGKINSEQDLNQKKRGTEGGEDINVPQKGIKTRKRIKDIMPLSDGEEEVAVMKTLKMTRSKDEQKRRVGGERSNKTLKNDGSGGSSSLIDDSKDEDSSLISKCKNLTQICKTDGAKGLCDELSKMVKGSLGTKLQKLKENSKIMTKINEIGQSLDKKGRSEVSISNSPPSRPAPPKSSSHLRNKSEHRLIKKTDHVNEKLDKTDDRVKQEHIEKWMRNVNSANRTSRQKSQTQVFDSDDDDDEDDHDDDNDDDEDDEEDDEFNEESHQSKFNDDDEILPRRHHRRLSNINEDSNDNDTIRRNNSHNKDNSRRNKTSCDRLKLSPARPPPPKRPPPPRPSSPSENPPEPLRTYKKPKELPTSVHDRLMRDMNSNNQQIRINRRSKSHQSIESFSAIESPERKGRNQKNHKQDKPKLPPPPRPPSVPKQQKRTKNGDSSGLDSDAIISPNTKYSNTLKKNHKSLETMASMVEYEINVHAESNLKIPQKRSNQITTRNKIQQNLRSVSPSPEKITASRDRHRTRSKPQSSNNSRHHSRHNIAPSLSPVERQTRHNNEEKTRRKPPIHR